MSWAWENNPAGVCEDAPCCGCCGPHGDGQIIDEPMQDDFDYDSRYDEGYDDDDLEPSDDPFRRS